MFRKCFLDLADPLDQKIQLTFGLSITANLTDSDQILQLVRVRVRQIQRKLGASRTDEFIKDTGSKNDRLQ